MKNFYSTISFLFLLLSITVHAQQLPNSNFEDWSGGEFDGVAQPASWHYSNVTQFGYKFNFAHQEAGHNGGKCIMMQDQDLKVAGIGETSPGYIALGQPWVYIESLTKVDEATAGTHGGISWKYRPDTMSVWIKRTGSNAMKEDFHLLYYAWNGTSHGDKYKGKNTNCTEVSWDDEESDIRQSTNGNECGTTTRANQVAEGWVHGRAVYNNWTQIKVPIYYIDNSTPTKMNIIFSASNYPNFRANDGLFAGNSLYVDDAQLIYSSKIQQLIIDGDEWKAFQPDSTSIQRYVVSDQVTTMPTIKAIRGAGQFTNSKGAIVTFRGRKLEGDEITITPGEIDKTPTLITVKAEDGSSEMTYQILFTHKLSNNAYLGGIMVNGQSIKGFSQTIYDYTAAITFGDTVAPVISVIKQEPEQTVSFTPPTSINDITTITVTAADGITKKTYTVRYKQAPLSDNTLSGIEVNGSPIPNFKPANTSYKVSIPLGTTQMPVVKPISKYAEGLQTIVMTPPPTIEGGDYIIAVSTPGNPVAKEYRLTFKMEASSNCQLSAIYINGEAIDKFMSQKTIYDIVLPVGTTSLPEITWDLGDPYQTAELIKGELEGTTRIVVTASDKKTQLTYRLNFTTTKSTISTLDGILLDGEMIAGFDKNITSYHVTLPIGTTVLPTIDVIKGDAYQQVNIISGGLNGTTRITVSAGNGSTTIYQITFSVSQATNSSLLGISVGGEPLPGFDPDILEYSYTLPQGTTQLPIIEYTPYDEYQTITVRSGGIPGDYRITVRPQSGSSRTYVIHFSVLQSSNSALSMIYLNNDSLKNFHPDTLTYIDTLDNTAIPNVSYDAYPKQKIFTLFDDNTYTIKVTAEDGTSRTYSIIFVVRTSKNAFLSMIYLDGDSLKDFQPERLSYSKLPIKNHACPVITVDSEQGQQVSILTPAKAGTASIVVTAGSGDNNTYLLELIDTATTPIKPLDPDPIYILSTDATLSAILVNNDTLRSFSPAKTTYSLPLAAGDSMPSITFVPNTDKQSIISGRISSKQFSALVTAENGDTIRYVVTIDQALFDDARLEELVIEGQTIEFDPNTYEYHLHLTEGEQLPHVSYTAKPGATSMFHATDANHQQILVTAQSGKQNTYSIVYTREQSSNALLSDILVNGTSLTDFDPNQFSYIDTLQWREQVVPVINALGSHPKQIITTSFSKVNGITRIHVVAANGITTADYSIAFPVKKSGNVKLNDLSIETDYTHNFKFDPSQTDYLVTLPYNATISPTIKYEKDELEQSISFIARPIGQANEITVQAENGNTRTYSITFLRDEAPVNVLQHIYYNIDGQDNNKELTLQNGIFNYSIKLPYGSSSLSFSYIKSFDEQTVVVQPGTTTLPTLFTVYSPLADTMVVYTITPELETQNPAVLKGITVNGSSIEDFDPNRFSYIVNCVSATQTPSVKYTQETNVTATDITTFWKSTITVTSGNYSNTYQVFFHYPNDVIPNGEFTEWTTTNVSKSDKPNFWNVPGDYLKDGYLWTVDASETVKKDGESSVKLSTVYWGALYGAIPPIINIADMSASYGVDGATTVTPSGYIGFHNSPDKALINYKYPDKAGNGALFLFHFVNSSGISYDFDHVQTAEQNNFAEYAIDLDVSQANITGMDIIVDGTNMRPKAPTGPLTDCKSALHIDYIRFAYNNSLKSIQVNGKEATKVGNEFEVTIDTKDILPPQLVFIGEVQDQAQKVVWSDPVREGEYSIRRASITNYGEDGKSSEYSLEVKRPLDATIALKSLMVNNLPLEGFSADQLNYTYILPYGTFAIPDIVPVLNSDLQTCISHLSDSVATIAITSEKGETRTYSIQFKSEKITNNSLADISAEGITFDTAKTSYEIEADRMPVIAITKRYDEQKVTVLNGKIDVELSGLPTTQYTIQISQKPIPTSGQLKEIELDGNLLPGFDPNIYEYEHAIPATMSFKRIDNTDSVVYVRKPDTLWWHVFGTESHSYKLSMPDASYASTSLQGIYVNDELIEGFNPQIDSYTVYTDSAVQLSVTGIDPRQQIDIQYAQSVYSIAVTAPNGIATATYTVQLKPTSSSEAKLQAILIDGTLLESFHSDRYQYIIELPVGTYKDHEPIIPSIQFVTSHPKASVEIEANKLGETTSLFVTSQDGIVTTQYELLIKAEPSHNASLTAIAINDVPLTNFQSNRFFYSVQMPPESITFDWRSQDRYQTVTILQNDSQYTLHVVAQDGQTYNDYVIEVFTQVASNDATIANIMLNGEAMSIFYPELNSDLSFNPGLNKYKVYMPSRLANLPNVSASLKLNGQTIHMQREGNTVALVVTAPDEISQNTYFIQFEEVLSSNTALKGILLDTTSMASFMPEQHFYYITLPTGQHTIPDVTPQWDKQAQKVSTSISSLPIGQQVLIDVTAEDGITSAQYRLLFQFTPSDADSLLMLFADGDSLIGFMPQTHQYSLELPRTASSFPVISWEKADKYQTVTTDTLINTPLTLSCDIIVTAENGKIRRYQVTCFKQPSSNTFLRNIYVNNQPVTGFDPVTNDYILTLNKGQVIDTIFWEEADTYQTITLFDTVSTLVPNAIATKQIHVVAENGDMRIYTLCFVQTLSTDSTLSMIYCNSHAVSNNYDEYNANYTIQLHQHGATLPLITYDKKNQHQNVEIHIIDSLHVHLLVTSEDSLHQFTYILTFLPYRSDNHYLTAIYVDGISIPNFNRELDSYTITLDSLHQNNLPQIGFDLAEPDCQQVKVDTTCLSAEVGLPPYQIKYTLKVVPENKTDTGYYYLTVLVEANRPRTPEESDNAYLSAIYIKGQLLSQTLGFDKDFDAKETNYHLTYPVGTNPDSFLSINDISVTKQADLATVIEPYTLDTIQTMPDSTNTHDIAVATCILITVMAPNGNNSITYHIYQNLELDYTNHTTNLLVADKTGRMRPIADFDPQTYYYEYTLSETASVVPSFALCHDNTNSRFVCVREDKSNDSRIVDCTDDTNYAFDNSETEPTYHIYYRAEDGTKYMYKIKFRRSEIKLAQKPMEGDVLIQPIPGSTQIAVASLRANVVFNLYDMAGRMVESVKLQEGNPNDFVVTTDGYGQTYFGHLTDFSSCTILTLEPYKIYFWVFFENGKRKIKSGKITILQ